MISQTHYNETGTAAGWAAHQDSAWFRDNPEANYRVRPMLEGESPLLDAVRDGQTGVRGYAIVINHGRLRDKRRVAGVIVYPSLVNIDSVSEHMLADDAQRMILWFRTSAKTPPARENEMWVGALSGKGGDL